jgi:hypothetical protein
MSVWVGRTALTGINVVVGDPEGRACDVRLIGPVHSAFFVQVSRASDRQDRQVGARCLLFSSGLGDILACWWDGAGAVLAGSKWAVGERNVKRMFAMSGTSGFSVVVEGGQCPCSDEDAVLR